MNSYSADTGPDVELIYSAFLPVKQNLRVEGRA